MGARGLGAEGWERAGLGGEGWGRGLGEGGSDGGGCSGTAGVVAWAGVGVGEELKKQLRGYHYHSYHRYDCYYYYDNY